MPDFGKLVKEEKIREIWPDEAKDFTPWLAEQENLKLLLEEVGEDVGGIEEIIPEDNSQGEFKADIVIKRFDSDTPIIIENQLETSDTRHLGQLIVYASGFNASSVIWVVKDIKEEHQNAIEWLNELSNDINFFLVRIEVWKIDNSKKAPKFNVIVEPNNWKRDQKLNSPNNDHRKFFDKFIEYVSKQENEDFRFYTPHRNYLNASYMRINVRLCFRRIPSRNRVVAQLLIYDESLFRSLHEQERDFTTLVDNDVDFKWPQEGINTHRIDCYKTADFDRKEKYEDYFNWMLESGSQLVRAYDQIINMEQQTNCRKV